MSTCEFEKIYQCNYEFSNPMDTVNKLGTQCEMPMDGAGGPTMTTQCDDGYAFCVVEDEA